jgi:hypothetical protein
LLCKQFPILIDGNTYRGRGEVYLELLPRAYLSFYGYFQGFPVKDAACVLANLTAISFFSINGHQIDGVPLSHGYDDESREFNVNWHPTSEPIYGVGDESSQMSFLVFHLFNFVDFSGARRSAQQNGLMTIKHVDLIYGQWNVELKSLPSTPREINRLNSEGGYRLTHVGGVKKADRALFSGKEGQECLTALSFFLSFAKGGWCAPICGVGFEESDNRVWESWSSPREPWHATLSWFDPQTGSQLTTLYPTFMKKWGNTDWREALREVIYWYLNANFTGRGIDAGIILTQAAIERLSYEYAVKDKRLLLPNGFKDLWASDKFRLLFSSLGIPLGIPKETAEMAKLAKVFNWLDAPHALTEIRNSLIHPEHKNRGRFQSVYYEAWNLGLWYLATGLLAVCGYSGTYWNRLRQRWLGRVEKVPWG